MKTVISYIDDLKTKFGSDNKAAKAINLRREAISNIRSRGQMSDETAIKIADALEIDRTEILLAATIARSEGEVRTSWEKISKLSGLAASLLITCFLIGYNAKEADAGGIYNLPSYTLCEVFRLCGVVLALVWLLSTKSQNHDQILRSSANF